MQFKQKLAYMALGGLLVFMGMLIQSSMNFPAVAQNTKQVASFDEITCKRLNIVDDSGRTYAVLKKNDVNEGIYDMIQIFNSSGTPVCSLGGSSAGGLIAVFDEDSKSGAGLEIGKYGGEIKAHGKDGKSSSELGITKYGGVVIADGKDGKSFSQLGIDKHGPVVTAQGKDGKSASLLGVNEYGGVVIAQGKNGGLLVIFNNGGQNCFQADITDIGDGGIRTRDKHGDRTGRLP